MRKSVLCLLLIAALSVVPVLSLSSCHGKGSLPDFQVPDEFDSSRNYEITFWAKNDTNLTQKNVYLQAIEDFESLYPNIKVNIRLYTDYGRIYNDVITNIPTDTTPNICITYPDHIATYTTGKNTIVPLDDLLKDSKYGLGGSELLFDGPSYDEMITKYLDECIIQGHHLGIPYMRSTEACYINKTYVDALGYDLPETLTWDFIWEVSEAAMKKDADGNFVLNGEKVMIPFIYKSTDNMMIQMLRQKGAAYSTDSGDILIFSDDTKELLRTVAEETEKGVFSTFKISGYPGNFLNAGQCVFAIDSTAGATWMGKLAPHADISPDKIVDYEIAVMSIPQFDPSDPKMISQGPSICVFNKTDPQEVLASWLFAQFLLTNKVQITYAQTEGYVPVTLKAQQSEEYLDYLSRSGEDGSLYYDVKISATKILIENTMNTFITPVFNGSASLRDAAGQLIENTVKSVRRKEYSQTDDYFAGLYSSISSLYRLDQLKQAQSGSGSFRSDLGRLPKTSAALIVCIVLAWTAIGVFSAAAAVKKKKNSKNRQ